MLFLPSKLVLISSLIVLSEGLKLSSIQKPYDKGVKAYGGERWSECIAQFEDALHLYKLYKSVVVNCRLNCNNEKIDSIIKEDLRDLKMYEIFFNRKQCITKCKEKNFEDLKLNNDIDETLLSNFQLRKPYEYLHICYFQMNALPKAASAAYTFLAANPEDAAMRHNLEYYLQQPEVNANEVLDLQSDDYLHLYNLGLKEYKKNNWADTVANMEEVINDYLSSENYCRMECEQQPEQEWSPEISITISNNIAALLHCQQQCQDKLKVIDYDSGVEFLAEILHYIQISYYHLGRYNDAAKATASYLMMIPTDEDMLENKRIYKTLADEKSFSERSDIEHYFKRDTYEKELLNFFHKGSGDKIDSNSI